MTYGSLGIFRYGLAWLHLIVLIHNWRRQDNAVGFEVSPRVRWTYKEEYESSTG